METKELKIQVPEGYEIDKENSTFECIKFKPIDEVITYEDVAKKLFCGEGVRYYISEKGFIRDSKGCNIDECTRSNNCTSEKQVEKLLAINKLMNVAKYLNGQPISCGYFLHVDKGHDKIEIGYHSYGDDDGEIHFASPDYADKAVEILGEETIRKALSSDW